MSKLPSLTGRQVIDALLSGGFQVVRVMGSHHFVQHEDGRAAVVPVHGGKRLGQD